MNVSRIPANLGITRSSRGQMEIFGLAIVVILLVLGMLFMLYFVAPRGGNELVQVFTDEQLSQNLITAALKVTTTCNNQELDNLVQDCAITSDFNTDLAFGGGGSINCGTPEQPQYSCVFMENAWEQILDNTLKAWNKRYYLRMYKSQGDTLFEINTPCPGNQIPGFGFIPLHPGTLTVQLNICS